MDKLIIFLSSFLTVWFTGAEAAESAKPNIVVIFADDLGYGDVGCFGSTTIETPNLDRMAHEGLKLTGFYAQTVCGPSRAALMTGCYPLRLATPGNKVGDHPPLHLNEITMAEALGEVGYRSIAIGKWGLAVHRQSKGVLPSLFPIHQGFDEFFGTPGSNDASVNLYRGEELIEPRADMSQLTKRYTDEAIRFIKESEGEPFFVYLAHTMPHIRLAVSEDFKGKSKGGLYSDVVEEIDFNVGRILKTLQEEGLDENTYVIFTSDNGPWYLKRSPSHLERFKRQGVSVDEQGGSAGPLRGAKTSSWEGGLRVPFIIRAPGEVPAGVESAAPAATIDLFPTLVSLAGGEMPADRVIDGRDVTSLLTTGDAGQIEEKPYFYYVRTRLEAVRFGKWKLHVPRSLDQKWAHYSEIEDAINISQPMLYNLDEDMSESNDLAASHPEVVAELMQHIEYARKDIGDFNRIGENARFFDVEPRRPDIR